VHPVSSYCTEVNPDKTKCTFTSRAQNARQIRNAKMANKSSESVANWQYLGGTLTDEIAFTKKLTGG
jgi:hypothetical protein